MSEMICDTVLQKNISCDQDNNFYYILYKSNLSKSTVNNFNKHFFCKEIEFDHIFTEEKKENKNENIVCSNFVFNNVLNFYDRQDKIYRSEEFSDIKDKKIEKKKTNKHKHHVLDAHQFLKNINYIKNFKKKNIKEKFKKIKNETILSSLIKNKNNFNNINKINHTHILKSLDLKKLNNHFFQKKINISNLNNKRVDCIKDNKKTVFRFNVKNNNNSLLFSKNIKNIDNIIAPKDLSLVFSPQETVKSYFKPLIFNDSKNSIEWKKLISNKILLSISNKENQAEIHLQPQSLGSIHIVINMKNNVARLKFFSKYKTVRTFLNNYIPFLQNSLIKNGIKLEKFNIYNSLKNTKLKSYKNMNFVKYKPIDLYV